METFRIRIWLAGLAVFALAGGCGSGDEGPTGPANHAPQIESQRDTLVVVDDTLNLRAIALDQDGDSLTYSVTTIGPLSDFQLRGFPDTEMDPVTGEFEFRARAIDRPDRVFRFGVRDHRGGVDSTTFRVNVKAKWGGEA